MDRAEALTQLPRAYALALQLADLGADADLIAECLGLEREAVPPLLEMAVAKLGRVLDTPQPPDPRSAGGSDPADDGTAHPTGRSAS